MPWTGHAVGVAKRRDVSLAAHVSFPVMRERGVRDALAFDPDFVREGFRLRTHAR
jgi:predicted nucleic acid-binding protein